MKAVLDLLISFSLVHSAAYPPAQLLDEDLRGLIENPETTLAHLESVDPEAAEILAQYISGYATLRKFYDVRDSVFLGDIKAVQISADKKKEAGRALISLIASCKQNISGGLYDRASGATVSIDGLLALLGEALVFVNRRPDVLEPDDVYTILEAVEDLETVSLRVYKVCDELLEACLVPLTGEDVHDCAPAAALKKLSSSLTASSGFSMLTGSFVNGGAGGSQTNGTASSSGVLVSLPGDKNNAGAGEEHRRGWDWRKGFDRKKFNGRDVLRQLRTAIAHDVAARALRPRRGADGGDGLGGVGDEGLRRSRMGDWREDSMRSARGFDKVGSASGKGELIPWL